MQKNAFSPLNQLDCISRIFPISGAIVVGAGMGEGAWFDLLRESDAPVLLIEAEAGRARQLDRDYVDRINWQVEQQVVAAGQQGGTFHILSNPSESTLLPIEELTDLWPNMKLKQQSACRTVTVSDLVQKIEFEPNWLILDCLPSLPLLQGEHTLLPSVDVVIVRVLADQSLCPTAQSAYDDVDNLMDDEGFSCLGLTPERHPALAHAVYVRDYAGMIQQQQTEQQNCQEQIDQINLAKTNAENQNIDLQQQLVLLDKAGEEQTRLASEHQSHIHHLTQKLNEQAIQAEERQHQIERLTQSLDEKANLAEERQQEIIYLNNFIEEAANNESELSSQVLKLTEERNTQNKLVSDCQQQIEQLEKSRDEQAKQAEERQQQFDALNTAKTDVEISVGELKVQIDELTNVKDEQAKLVTELQSKFVQINQAKSEVDQLATQRQEQIERLTQSLDEKANLAEERQQEITALNKTKEEVTHKESELSAQVQKLTEDRNTQNKLISDCKQQIEQLAKSRDEQTKQTEEQKLQIDQLSKGKSESDGIVCELKQQIEKLQSKIKEAHEEKVTDIKRLTAEIEAVSRERDTNKAELSSALQGLEEARSKVAELQISYQQAMNEKKEAHKCQAQIEAELTKAEAQIELIKELLLSEPPVSSS